MWRSLLRLSVLLVCGCWLVAQNPQLEEAWSLAAKGDRSAALTLLNRLVQQTPQDPDVRLLYGSLLSEAGQGPEALQQLSEGVRLRPNSAEAQDALGEALNRFGNSTAARLHFQKAVELKPDFPEARLNLGETLVAANEFEPAAKQLDKAIALFGSNPDVADARYLRGKVYSAQGDFMHAAAQFELAVAARPDFAAAWSDLGQSKKESLDDSGALSAFQRAVQINPQDAIAQYRLGAQYMAQGQMDSAIDHLNRIVTGLPRGRELYP